MIPVTTFDWIIMPVVDCWDYTIHAVEDCLQQGINARLLIIDNASDEETRHKLDQLQLQREGQILVWHHDPPLPSLSATWNHALHFVWATGESHALVLNNDVRLWPGMYARLKEVREKTGAYFLSAVGTSEADWATVPRDELAAATWQALANDPGGPDFSCFLLSKTGHQTYPFDERFIPCYCEDLDMHRRYMLGDDGRRIFSINIPFLHYASRTINRSEEAKRAFDQVIGQSRAYYKKKWGGNVNEERFREPFGGLTGADRACGHTKEWKGQPITTPELQRAVHKVGWPHIEASRG